MTDEAQLGASIDLSIDAALANVQTLASSTEDAMVQASEAASEALANASAVQPAALTVTADTTEAEHQITALQDDADSVKPVVAVEADTTDAQSAIADLGSEAADTAGSLDTASSSAHGFGVEAGAVGGLAGLATGDVKGLGEAVGGIEGVSGGAVAGVAAIGAGIGELVHEGLNATSAVQRFNTIVGDMKDQVEHINVGTLNTSMKELGLQFGSTDAEMKNTTASLFQFAINSGASREAAADFATKIEALAGRAVALNQGLGNVGDVAEQMGVRIARGGRFATQFGLALTANEIATRASADANGKAANQLTIYEKAQAAANIAAERYGGVLGKDVADGAKNAANESKSLTAELREMLEAIGKPLVGGFLDAFRASLPDIKELATVLGQLGAAALPIVIEALKDITPLLQIATELVKGFTQAFGQLGAQGEVTGAVIGFALGGPIGAAIGGTVGLLADLTKALDSTGESADEMRKRIAGLTTELRGLGPAAAAAKFIKSTFPSKDDIVTLDPLVKSLKELANQSPTTAKIVEDGFSKMDLAGITLNGHILTNAQAQKDLKQAVEGGTGAFADHAAKANEVAQGDQAITDKATGAKPAIEGQTTATQGAATATSQWATAMDALVKQQQELENRLLGLPGATLNYQNAVASAKTAQDNLNQAQREGGHSADELAQLQRDVEDANLRVAQAALDLKDAQDKVTYSLTDPSAGNIAAIDMELQRLHDVIATSPAAAAALQPQVDKLTEARDRLRDIQAANNLGISVDVLVQVRSSLSPDDQKLFDWLSQAPPGTATIDLPGGGTISLNQFGGVYPPTRAGQLALLGEAGNTDVVLSTANTPAENAALLTRAGLILPPAPLRSPVAGVAPSSHQVHTDNSVTTYVDARGATEKDATMVGIAVARRQRAELSAKHG